MSQIFFIFIILLSKFRLLYLFSCHFQEIKNLTYSTLIFSTKNCASSFSGISADSRIRYSAISHQYHHSHWIDQAFQYVLGFLHIVPLHCLISEFSQTKFQSWLSRLTIERREVWLATDFSVKNVTVVQDTNTSTKRFIPQGFHPLCIRELRRFSNSCIIYKKEIKVWLTKLHIHIFSVFFISFSNCSTNRIRSSIPLFSYLIHYILNSFISYNSIVKQ